MELSLSVVQRTLSISETYLLRQTITEEDYSFASQTLAEMSAMFEIFSLPTTCTLSHEDASKLDLVLCFLQKITSKRNHLPLFSPHSVIAADLEKLSLSTIQFLNHMLANASTMYLDISFGREEIVTIFIRLNLFSMINVPCDEDEDILPSTEEALSQLFLNQDKEIRKLLLKELLSHIVRYFKLSVKNPVYVMEETEISRRFELLKLLIQNSLDSQLRLDIIFDCIKENICIENMTSSMNVWNLVKKIIWEFFNPFMMLAEMCQAETEGNDDASYVPRFDTSVVHGYQLQTLILLVNNLLGCKPAAIHPAVAADITSFIQEVLVMFPCPRLHELMSSFVISKLQKGSCNNSSAQKTAFSLLALFKSSSIEFSSKLNKTMEQLQPC